MKFFTRQWSNGTSGDEEGDLTSSAYLRHLEAADLPPSAKDLAKLNAHDAYILEVTHQSAVDSLRLRFRNGDLQIGYFDAVLDFTGVSIDPAQLNVLIAAKRPAAFEILYDEVDRIDRNTFVYRLLLEPAGEVELRFRDVSIDRQCADTRYAK